jgi:branched-chain amino acid transport system substrate-binding protein
MKSSILVLAILLAACSSVDKSGSRGKQTPKTVKQDKKKSQIPGNDPWQAFRTAVDSSLWQQVMDNSETLLKSSNLTKEQYIEIYRGRLRAFEVTEFYFNGILDIDKILQNPTLSSEHEFFKSKAFELIEGRLFKSDLEKVAESSINDDFRAQANFRLGQINLEEKNQDQARRYYARAVNLSPQTDIGRRAKDLLEQLESARKVESKTIGVVLPVTGKFAPVSKKTLRGIQMGLGLYGGGSSSFKLAVVDSEGNPENARRGVERLVKEDNVIAIIGSVLSKTSTAVAAKAAELGVPSITLSQKSGVTDTSTNVFRNSLTSEMQVRYLAKVATEELGLKRFAVLFPNDQYGVEFTNIFWDEVLARGGSIVSAQTYSNKETDFRNPIQRLIGTYFIEDRAEEYKYRLKEWSDSLTKRSARTVPPEDLLPPIVDFDAIFIPDSAKSLGQISAMLSYNGVKGVKLLGTNLWNVPGLAKRTGLWAKDIVFVDSFVTTDALFQKSPFVRDYKTLFGEEPGMFEIQGYDSAIVLKHLISEGKTSRESLTSSLAGLQDFPGSLGKLTMSPEREIQRPIVALTIEGTEIVPLRRTTTP